MANQIEYRIEHMPYMADHEEQLSAMLARLTELGKDGWRPVSIDLTYHPQWMVGAQSQPLPVLFMREVQG